MKSLTTLVLFVVMAVAGGMLNSAAAANVKVTPLGANDGEFCLLDRAMVFEDPNGTRILYDAGVTVRGADDPRLGKIDAVLLSHVHWDHLGSKHVPSANAGPCGKPKLTVNDAPDSNTVKITVAKKAVLVIGGELHALFGNKVKHAGGEAKQVRIVRFGASTTVGGVKITTVPAVHSNGLDPVFMTGKLAEEMKDNGLTAYVGPPGGYVLTFSNGLVVYLSGDTGITAEQKLVVHDYYHAKLAVMNIGDVYTTGPTEAAYVVNDLVKPNEVIASHANQATTENGKVKAGTRTDIFMKATHVPVRVPLSGRTMEFDSDGKCRAGC